MLECDISVNAAFVNTVIQSIFSLLAYPLPARYFFVMLCGNSAFDVTRTEAMLL